MVTLGSSIVNNADRVGDIDWGEIITSVVDTAGKVVPQIIQNNRVNKYGQSTVSYDPNAVPQNTGYPTQQTTAPGTSTGFAGMSTTTLLALGLGGLVLFKMMKKGR